MLSRFASLCAATLVAVVALVPVGAAQARSGNIVQTAAAAGQFNTLIAAAKAAGLAKVLSRTHNLTVFAPTDAAFARLGRRTINDLLKPKNRAKLRKILLYHVLRKSVRAKQIPAGRTHVRTLAGKSVAVRKTRFGVRVNRARVIAADVKASNGVIHVIDRVLLPH